MLVRYLLWILCIVTVLGADETVYTRRVGSGAVSYPRPSTSSSSSRRIATHSRTSSGDSPRRTSLSYTRTYSGDSLYPRRTSKTVVTRPAMRLHRYRPTIRRRMKVPGSPAITGVRRVILRGGSTYRSRYGGTKATTAAVPTAAANSTLEPEATSTEEEVQPTTAAPSTSSTTTSSTQRKPTRYRNMQDLYSLRRSNKDAYMEYSELMRKLDFFMAYYPSVREAASRLSNMLTKHEQTSREERLRIWKKVFRVRSELNAKYEILHRNVTELSAKANRRAREFKSYQETNKKKIDQIEMHQGSQDEQYFSVYERTTNNSNEIQQITADMSVLLPLVTNLLENFERSNLQEKRALEMLDSHARGNIADMTNQILVQQNTLASLGNQVRTEMDLLHAEKQSMAKSVEQHNRKITETVNSHLSAHVKQMNHLEGLLNRQDENIKYITTVVSRHDGMIDVNHALGFTFLDQVANISEELKKVEANITRFEENQENTQMQLNHTQEAVERLEENTRHLVTSLNNQHQVIAQTMDRMNTTEGEIRSVSTNLNAYKTKQRAETNKLRDDLDGILEMQQIQQDNISGLLSWRDTSKGATVPYYPSDEPAPEPTSVTSQELKSLLAELGVEDRMSRLTRVLRHQQQRMSNVTKAVVRIAEDNEAITETTSQYFGLINSQSKVIKDQNETISKLAMIATKQGDTIARLSTDLMAEQETVMKLTHILANIAAQFKSPMGSQRDCHDVWLNGNRRSGVYNVIEDMSLRPVQCNLTEYGGWTVIQRRKDGSQDFDRTLTEYQNGFGDVYGEYWLGLNTIMTLTQKVRPNVAMQIVMEDWEGQVRTATYSRFYLYGKSYSLSVNEYTGDAGDSLSQANGMPFEAKTDANAASGGRCSARRSSGWWYTLPKYDCGESNLNGVYRQGPTQDARIQSTIYWKRWHGVGYPLKSITMQILPSEVLETLKSTQSTVEVNGHSSRPNSDTGSNSSPYGEQPYGGRSQVPSYEDDLLESGVGSSEEIPSDYDNFDYDRYLNDG